MNLHFSLAISFIALSVVCQAQVPTDNEAYEAWKLTQIQHPQSAAPPHPAASHTAMEYRGGGGEAPCACWIEPDSTYTIAMPETDEGHSAMITLPFTFSLFGFPFDSLYIMNNGFISFNHPFEVYSGVPLSLGSHPIIAPFFTDVDTRDSTPAQDFLHGEVFYKLTSHALYVNWVSVGYYNEHGDLRDSFQVIITDGTDSVVPGGNNVSFCYGSMQWITGDLGGVNGFGGNPVHVGAATGNSITWVQGYVQLGSFIQNNSEWNGPYADSSGVGWLTDRHFIFNTTTVAVPPIFSNMGCDTLEVEAGLSLNYPMLMIAGLSGQVVTGASSCSGIAGYMETSNTIGDTAQILSNIAPTQDEVGMHTINYTAQNDAEIPLESTYTVYVKVLPGLTTGISPIGTAGSITLLPNPADDKVTVSWPADQQPTLIQVIAMDGSIAMSHATNPGSTRMQLDVSGLSAGVYTVRVAGPVQVSTIRLVHSAGQ